MDSQLRMLINTKTNGKQKWSEDSRKMTFLLISHQTILVLEKHRFAHRPWTSEEYRNVVLFCYADNKKTFEFVFYCFYCLTPIFCFVFARQILMFLPFSLSFLTLRKKCIFHGNIYIIGKLKPFSDKIFNY